MTSAAQTASNKIEADWDQKALSAAIDAAREVTSGEAINRRATVGSLSDIEWMWICAAAVFAWIKTKSRQATEEGSSADPLIRSMKGRDPEPWEAGAVESILPALGELELPWQITLADWPKDAITSLSWHVYRLVNAALAVRDEGAIDKITRRISSDEIEREASVLRGGPLMTHEELSDQIPF